MSKAELMHGVLHILPGKEGHKCVEYAAFIYFVEELYMDMHTGRVWQNANIQCFTQCLCHWEC